MFNSYVILDPHNKSTPAIPILVKPATHTSPLLLVDCFANLAQEILSITETQTVPIAAIYAM